MPTNNYPTYQLWAHEGQYGLIANQPTNKNDKNYLKKGLKFADLAVIQKGVADESDNVFFDDILNHTTSNGIKGLEILQKPEVNTVVGTAFDEQQMKNNYIREQLANWQKNHPGQTPNESVKNNIETEAKNKNFLLDYLNNWEKIYTALQKEKLKIVMPYFVKMGGTGHWISLVVEFKGNQRKIGIIDQHGRSDISNHYAPQKNQLIDMLNNFYESQGVPHQIIENTEPLTNDSLWNACGYVATNVNQKIVQGNLSLSDIINDAGQLTQEGQKLKPDNNDLEQTHALGCKAFDTLNDSPEYQGKKWVKSGSTTGQREIDPPKLVPYLKNFKPHLLQSVSSEPRTQQTQRQEPPPPPPPPSPPNRQPERQNPPSQRSQPQKNLLTSQYSSLNTQQRFDFREALVSETFENQIKCLSKQSTESLNRLIKSCHTIIKNSSNQNTLTYERVVTFANQVNFMLEQGLDPLLILHTRPPSIESSFIPQTQERDLQEVFDPKFIEIAKAWSMEPEKLAGEFVERVRKKGGLLNMTIRDVPRSAMEEVAIHIDNGGNIYRNDPRINDTPSFEPVKNQQQPINEQLNSPPQIAANKKSYSFNKKVLDKFKKIAEIEKYHLQEIPPSNRNQLPKLILQLDASKANNIKEKDVKFEVFPDTIKYIGVAKITEFKIKEMIDMFKIMNPDEKNILVNNVTKEQLDIFKEIAKNKGLNVVNTSPEQQQNKSNKQRLR